MRSMLLIGSLFIGMAVDNVPNDRTPEAQFAAMSKEYDAAMADWSKTFSGVKTTDPAYITKVKKSPTWIFAPLFVKFAEANPHDTAAAEAALKVITMAKTRDKAIFPSFIRARDLLIRHHLQEERVVQTMLSRPFHDAGQTEPYFQALMAASRDRDTIARAAMALVTCNETRASIAAKPYFDHLEDDPERLVVNRFLIDHLDPDYIRYFRTADTAALSRDREVLLERVIREYGDISVAPPWVKPELREKAKAAGLTLGKKAEEKLDALRTVGVGMVAPEIEGTDVDGAPLRLSDYRGKVVVLVFWGTWCGPCMAFLPTEKSLVERLKDRPFVLLGVNSDKDRAALKSASKEKGITWRSWFDGGVAGPIASRWNVHGWPSIIVIDKAGVIRFKGFPYYAPKPLNDAVDSLLAEK